MYAQLASTRPISTFSKCDAEVRFPGVHPLAIGSITSNSMTLVTNIVVSKISIIVKNKTVNVVKSIIL